MEERTEETRDAQAASVGDQTPLSGALPELTDQQREIVSGTLGWMEATLGIDRTRRLADNDWTLIVKYHAMIETALNAALVRQFDAPELSRVIGKLDTSNPGTGKVAFAKALKMIMPSSAVFIQKLSELRNFCVHDIRNFDFQIEKYLESLSEEKRNELVKPIMKLLRREFKSSTSFREALFVGVMQVMMELQLHDMQCDVRALNAELHRRTYEIYEAQKQSKTKEG